VTEDTIVITDANVLIDYAKTNKRVLLLLSRLFREVKVPYEIFKEVNEITVIDASEYHLDVFYPAIDIIYNAANIKNALSFQDNICLMEARKNGWAVITNDRKLKELCEVESIETYWGLQVLMLMVTKGIMTKEVAMNTAAKIADVNAWISKNVIEDFKRKCRDL